MATSDKLEVQPPMVHTVTTVQYTKSDICDIIDHLVDGGIKLVTAVQKVISKDELLRAATRAE
jgi:thiamine monophosphate synthase